VEGESVRRLLSAIRSGLRGLRMTPLVFALSVTTMAAGLLLLATYMLVVLNLRAVLDRFGHDLAVVAFMEPNAHAPDVLEKKLAMLPGVHRIRYVSSAEALKRLRKDLGDEASILEDLKSNPLPASFEIELELQKRSPERVRALAHSVEQFDSIAEVRYGEEWVEGYSKIVHALEWIGVLLGGVLILILGTIVVGTVRLALYARSDEIQIQRLVGADGLFVRLPFYLEGAIQGALAAGLALGTLYGLFRLGLPVIGELLAFLLGPTQLQFFSGSEMVILFVLGVVLGVGGAFLSLIRLEERA